MPTIAQTERPNSEGQRVPVTIRLLRSIDRAVEIVAAHRDVSKQALIEAALRAFLAQSDEVQQRGGDVEETR